LTLLTKAYPDGLIGQYWDPKKQCPISQAKANRVGDGLARFITQELFETFDADASTSDQLNEAVRVMENAAREVNGVITAFLNAG
jgi:hypothetical protein